MTAKGDKGITDLPKLRNVRKDHERIRACAALDEAACFIGLARARLGSGERARALAAELKLLCAAQEAIIYVCAQVAGLNSAREIESRQKQFDDAVARLQKGMAPARSFVLPGASEAEALVHCARAKCRSAETMAAGLRNCSASIKLLNRLSKYLFLLSRQKSVLSSR